MHTAFYAATVTMTIQTLTQKQKLTLAFLPTKRTTTPRQLQLLPLVIWLHDSNNISSAPQTNFHGKLRKPGPSGKAPMGKIIAGEPSFNPPQISLSLCFLPIHPKHIWKEEKKACLSPLWVSVFKFSVWPSSYGPERNCNKRFLENGSERERERENP